DQHQIRRLQIPVDEALLFRCGQCAADLQGDVDGRERVERPCPANTHLQRFAFYQFHRAEALPVLFADTEVVNRRNIWMPQRCRSSASPSDAFATVPPACSRKIPRYLERSRATSLRSVVIGRPSLRDISSYGTAASPETDRCEFNCLNSSSFPASAHSSASRSSAWRSSVSAHSRS